MNKINYSKFNQAVRSAGVEITHNPGKKLTSSDLKVSNSQFVDTIHRSFKKLNQLSLDDRLKVAAKLSDCSLEFKEKIGRTNKIALFFHKLGQLFQGHGFRTKSEWVDQLEKKVRNLEYKKYEQDFQQTFLESDQVIFPKKFNHLINNLENNTFQKMVHQLLDLPHPKDANKAYGFYIHLAEENKKKFITELLNRNDWFDQLKKLVENVPTPLLENEILKDSKLHPTLVDSLKEQVFLLDEKFTRSKSIPEKELILDLLMLGLEQDSERFYELMTKTSEKLQKALMDLET